MKIPTIQGIIKRRILVNYRAASEVIQKILPSRFRPKLYHGKAIVGICLIRLAHIRPKFAPAFVGIASENAAHRIAVEWNDENGNLREGVYIPRRDTDSFINATIGGTLFSGVYHKAKFKIDETESEIDYDMKSDDEKVSVNFAGSVSDKFPTSSIFASLGEASNFFKTGSLGLSVSNNSKKLDGILLQIDEWKVLPFQLNSVHSGYYGNEKLFPAGTVEFDHALCMQNTVHEWHSAGSYRLD